LSISSDLLLFGTQTEAGIINKAVIQTNFKPAFVNHLAVTKIDNVESIHAYPIKETT